MWGASASPGKAAWQVVSQNGSPRAGVGRGFENLRVGRNREFVRLTAKTSTARQRNKTDAVLQDATMSWRHLDHVLFKKQRSETNELDAWGQNHSSASRRSTGSRFIEIRESGVMTRLGHCSTTGATEAAGTGCKLLHKHG